MRIAAFIKQGAGSAHYRALEPMRELRRRGHDVVVRLWEWDDAGWDRSVEDADVVFVQREMSRPVHHEVRRMRDAGAAVVWDMDDDVMSSSLVRRGGLRSQQTASTIRALFGLADVVTTTREPLARSFEAGGASCVLVVPNYLPQSAADVRRAPSHGGVVIGWIAWRDHQQDWKELGLGTVVQRLLATHDGVRFVSVGPIDLALPADRYERVAPVAFEDLPRQIARFDIGIAPIADVPFNRSRSDIKVKEYAITGVPWVASPIGPYQGLGEREGGRLAADDEWFDALDELVRAPRLRRRLARRGRRWAAKQTLSRHVGMWEAAFAEARRRARERSDA